MLQAIAPVTRSPTYAAASCNGRSPIPTSVNVAKENRAPLSVASRREITVATDPIVGGRMAGWQAFVNYYYLAAMIFLTAAMPLATSPAPAEHEMRLKPDATYAVRSARL